MIVIGLFLLLSSAFAQSYECKPEYEKLEIPSLTADSMEEFYYCFGYLHGKDRAWQMDYFRRTGQGRNAEVLGYSQLKSDLMMKLLDLPALAGKLWKGFPSERKKILEMYSSGVNSGFVIGKDAREFKDLDFTPEPWKPEHTILVLLLQSFDQTRKTFSHDYEEEQRKENWGSKAQELFSENDVPWNNTILRPGEYEVKEASGGSSFHRKRVKIPKLWSLLPSVFGEESGSNNWVVSASRSKTGNALLANDPHLDLKTPLFWYWVNLMAPGVHVLGASLPGVPVIASGTNGNVSWGLTNSYLNTADAVFITDLKDEQVESFRPLVKIKFWIFQIPFFFKTFERLTTGHNVLPLDAGTENRMVLRWTGYSLKPEDVSPMFDLFKTRNTSEMDELLSQIGLPSWNFVFADTKGDIGMRLVGKTYKHLERTSFGIPFMSLKEFLHEDLLSPDERPHVLNPERQYVYTANNRHWPQEAKYYGGRAYKPSFRGFRIDELLQGEQDVESFKDIQCDVQVTDARFFLPKLLKYLEIPELQGWSLLALDSSRELPLYRRLMDSIMEKWKVDEYALFRLLDRPNSKQVEDLKAVLEAVRKEVGERSWGDIHRLPFSHMSKNKNWVFSPEIAGVGDKHTINPGSSSWNENKKIYEQFSGASMRMIVEMAETPRVWLSLPGINREYDKAHDKVSWSNWKNCKFTEVDF